MSPRVKIHKLNLPLLIPFFQAPLNLDKKVSDFQFETEFQSVLCSGSVNIPFATIFSIKHKIPLGIIRESAKGYGTDKLIEGYYPEKFTNAILFCNSLSNILSDKLKNFELDNLTLVETANRY